MPNPDGSVTLRETVEHFMRELKDNGSMDPRAEIKSVKVNERTNEAVVRFTHGPEMRLEWKRPQHG